MPDRPAPPRATLESALYADDLAAAEVFYKDVIGLPLVLRQPGRHVFFRVGSSILLVFNPAATAKPQTGLAALEVPAHGSVGAGHYCFAVPGETLEGWKHYLTDQDIPIDADIVWPNGARSIYVRDPAGNSIEFAEPALWQ